MSCFLFICLHTTPTPIVRNPEFGRRGSLANTNTHRRVDRWIHNWAPSTWSLRCLGFKTQACLCWTRSVCTRRSVDRWTCRGATHQHNTLMSASVHRKHMHIHNCQDEVDVLELFNGTHQTRRRISDGRRSQELSIMQFLTQHETAE